MNLRKAETISRYLSGYTTTELWQAHYVLIQAGHFADADRIQTYLNIMHRQPAGKPSREI